MHEPRGNPGNRISNGIQLLPKQTGSIAPDHPPKQTQAWVRLQFILHKQSLVYIIVCLVHAALNLTRRKFTHYNWESNF